MKKLLFIFLAALTVSCSSDDSSGTNPNKDGSKLKSIERISYQLDENGEKIFNDKRTEEYLYGSNGYANKVITTVSFTTSTDVSFEDFEYNGNSLKQTIFSYDNYYGEEKETRSYQYNNNLIIKETVTRNKHASTVNYKYNSSKNLVYSEVLSDNELRMSSDFTYDNKGNMIKVNFRTYFDDYSFTASYQYDNKNNPLKNVFPKAFLKTIRIGENNVIDMDGQKIEYEYNELGYPIKAIESNRTTTYEYY